MKKIPDYIWVIFGFALTLTAIVGGAALLIYWFNPWNN